MELMGVNADSTRKIFKWTYEGTLTTMPSSVIFVVDGKQSDDLVYKNHGYYIDGTWSKEITNYVAGAPTVTIDKESGKYEGSVTVTLTASVPDAVIVYTTDGTAPTTSSPQATGSKQLTFTDNTTLSAGILHEGKVRNVVSREYIFHEVQPTTATIYLKDPMVAPNLWSNLYFYAWDGGIALTDAWPGVAVTDTKMVKGEKFYYRTFTKPTADYVFNIIFNQGDGAQQTVDITNLTKDTYFEISSTTSKYTVTDITSQYGSVFGDVNGDGKVDVSDVTTLINVILSTGTYDEKMCDLNGDGNVDASDVTILITLISQS